ncbi:protocadherin beta-16-like [Alligator mississippiensis]|uniref:protocadherin beta-16-like n=1 Tax=Alligator mississippiensis TaxID=8496 RepID=UPI00287739E2|nr:protocadherin beta-16-like [Alligator mississippiensis]
MADTGSRTKRSRQAASLLLLLCVGAIGSETVRYSVPEEMESGSFVANVAKDVGLEPRSLSARRARLVSDAASRHFQLNGKTGDLLIKEKLDREELCGQTEPCLVRFELVLENPLQSYRAEVRVTDINDHSPIFKREELVFRISETAFAGSRFPLERAQDLDVGNNSLQSYSLSSSGHFHIHMEEQSDGTRHAELVLDQALDREQQPELSLLLTALDGGSPPRSGTAQIRVLVLDINDNPPVFSRATYKAQVPENSPRDYLVVGVSATDLDEGTNGEISYSFSQQTMESSKALQINAVSGEIRLLEELDFETRETYELYIQATDGGGLSAHCKVLVEVVDVNDNAPEVTLTSLISPIPEDAPPETVVALLSVRDRDSGDNGRAACSIEDALPFSLKATFRDSYALVTERALDRESVSEYNITIVARDQGAPSLSAEQRIRVRVSDINDNAPVFSQAAYTMHVRENTAPGTAIGTVRAADADAEHNARVTYSLVPAGAGAGALPVLAYVAVNSADGSVYALRSLDYEQTRQLEVGVRATDAGSPALSSEAVVRVVVLDENDNAPFVLHPLQNSTAAWSELVPRSAEPGYLVTKVVAVDADAGQNAWLSYQLLRATEPGLFAVALHSGEVRTSRPLTERDTVKHRLIVLVRDSGESPLSSSATLNILLVDGFSDAYLQSADAAAAAAEGADTGALTMYLTVSLCLVSFLFLLSVVTFVLVKVCRRRGGGEQYTSAPGTLYGDGNLPRDWVDVSGTGTLSRSYRYEVCLSTGSGSSDFRFLRPLVPCPPQQGGCVVTGSGKERDLLTDSHAPADLEGADQVRAEWALPPLFSMKRSSSVSTGESSCVIVFLSLLCFVYGAVVTDSFKRDCIDYINHGQPTDEIRNGDR